MKRFILSVLFVAAAIATYAQSALKLPALSPTAKVSQDFSLSGIELSYSRPSMRGRTIFGDVVPYGKVWRTGANAPTKIKIGEDLVIAGQKVKAGEYALYTIPDRDSWRIILNTGAGSWTAEGFPSENDIARFTVKAEKLETDVQTFTINITDITYNTCKLEIEWERTKVVLPIVANNSDAVETNIDKAINHPAGIPYNQTANYYYETNQKTDLALSYINKALEQDPNSFNAWYLKARIERRLGHNDEAIAAARKSIETAKGTPFEYDYVHNSNKLIEEINNSGRHKQSND